jgi:hypothetical protein
MNKPFKKKIPLFRCNPDGDMYTNKDGILVKKTIINHKTNQHETKANLQGNEISKSIISGR